MTILAFAFARLLPVPVQHSLYPLALDLKVTCDAVSHSLPLPLATVVPLRLEIVHHFRTPSGRSHQEDLDEIQVEWNQICSMTTLTLLRCPSSRDLSSLVTDQLPAPRCLRVIVVGTWNHQDVIQVFTSVKDRRAGIRLRRRWNV
jgi:hypothetical protein